MKLTLRRQLFLAILGAMALPLVLFSGLSVLYLRRERAAIETRFVDDARAAAGRQKQGADSIDLSLTTQLKELAFVVDDPQFAGEKPEPQPADPLVSALQEATVRRLGPYAAVESVSLIGVDGPIVTLQRDGFDFGVSSKPDPDLKKVLPAGLSEALSSGSSSDYIAVWEPLADAPGQKSVPVARVAVVNIRGPEDWARRVTEGDDVIVAGMDWRTGYRLAPRLGRSHYLLVARERLDELYWPLQVGSDGWLVLAKDGTPEPSTYPILLESGARPWEPRSVDEPDLSEISGARPKLGELSHLTTSNGHAWVVYALNAYEMDFELIREGVDDLAVVPAEALYAPLEPLKWGMVAAIGLCLLLALASASLLSGRWVGTVRAVQSGVEAIAQGDWKPMPKLSGDELGGELVETVNRTATRLVERTRREELDTWRRMVRVMSHEINNTLTPVRSVAATLGRSLAKRLKPDDAGRDASDGLELIVERVDSLSSFLAGYAELAKLPPPEFTDADLGQLVQDSVRMVSELASEKRVRLDVELEKGLEAIRVDPKQMERVLLNLLENAVQAAPEGGTVRVRAASSHDLVEIAIEDDGPGIAPEARKNLFVPFFTTKPGGSGIGLALVRQIVLAHAGLVTAEEGRERGALFRVSLPRAATRTRPEARS